MKNLRLKIKNLLALDQLKADGGTLLRGPEGSLRKKRVAKFAVAGGTAALSLVLALASLGLPFPGKVRAEGVKATEIFANDGTTLLYKIRGDKNRSPIPFEQMPGCIKQATVAVEDQDFYKHQGLDPRGLARAVKVNLQSGNSTAQGGSTITQQLVKNALLSPEQTYTRKAKELVLSLEIEQMFAKDDILRLYLNEIPYGNSAYGVQAAAQTYFGKDAKDLSLAQCATLAGMPRAPSFYSPYNSPDPERLKRRAKYVLDRMVGEQYVSGDDSAAAKAQIDTGLEFAAAKGEEIKAPHFVFYVREQLEQRYGSKVLQEGGLKVKTTLDYGKQQIAEDVIAEAARNRFKGYGASNAALTSLDPKTGQVLAMVGSVDYFNVAAQGNVNVATADRQPGSSFKPLVYLAAFKKGRDPNLPDIAFNPATLLWDVKTDFGGYAPNNYDNKFRGPVNARDALQQSLNVPSVKMLDLIGPRAAIDFAHEMGITTLNESPDRYGDSLVLGGGEVKLLDLTASYNVMADQGQRNAVNSILEVRNTKGKQEKIEKPKQTQPVSNELAYQITDVLKDDQARAPQFGRNSALTLPGREAAAKTGTTDSFRDGWTVGYTPQLTAGVWIGNNDNTPMNRVGGSVGAAPIWQEYMKRALEGQPEQKFERPGGVKDIKVNRVTGQLPNNGDPTKTEIFTDGNAPRQKSVQTNADPCGSDVKVEGLKSERPTNPAWENPVQAYIRANGIVAPGGSRTNAGNSEQCGPEVSITSPGDGEQVSGTIQIQARATSPRGIKSVELSYDGQVVDTLTRAPFSTSYTIRDTGGRHTVSAKATDSEGNTKTAQITVTVSGQETTPTPEPSTTPQPADAVPRRQPAPGAQQVPGNG